MDASRADAFLFWSNIQRFYQVPRSVLLNTMHCGRRKGDKLNVARKSETLCLTWRIGRLDFACLGHDSKIDLSHKPPVVLPCFLRRVQPCVKENNSRMPKYHRHSSTLPAVVMFAH